MIALVLVLLLAGVGTVGAKEQWPLCSQVSDIDSWYNDVVRCDSKRESPLLGSTKELMAQADCLAQMEAAMRAMDKFVGWNPVTGRIILDETRADNPHQRDTIIQWYDAKRDCWRTP